MTTEFRTGLPSKAQVKAHAADGGLWEDRGPAQTPDGRCCLRLDSEGEIIVSGAIVGRPIGPVWDKNSYRPIKIDHTPVDWESLTVTIPAGTKDPDLQALYAIVDGAPGPAPIPVDVEEEWNKRVNSDASIDGDWNLRSRNGQIEAVSGRVVWTSDDSHFGEPLREMRDILDTVAAARKGSTTTIASPLAPDLDRQLDSLTQTLTLIREQDRARKRVCEDLEKRVRDLQAQVVAAIERAEKAEAKVRALEGVGQAKAGEGRFRNLEID